MFCRSGRYTNTEMGAVTQPLATFLLFIGTVFAAIVVLGQVREARETRQDSLRPIVRITKAYTDGWTIRVTLKNVGPGAASKVH